MAQHYLRLHASIEAPPVRQQQVPGALGRRVGMHTAHSADRGRIVCAAAVCEERGVEI